MIYSNLLLPEITFQVGNPKYNPFENPRFLKMMGWENAIEIYFSYGNSYSIVEHDKCYRDTDPDYYDDDY